MGAEIGNFDENFDPIFTHKKEVKLRKSYSFPPAKNKFKVARAMCLPTLKRIIRK